MSNTTIRETAKTNRIPLWRIADVMGISEATLTRKLRHEMSEAESQQMLKLIHGIKEVKPGGSTGANQEAHPDGR